MAKPAFFDSVSRKILHANESLIVESWKCTVVPPTDGSCFSSNRILDVTNAFETWVPITNFCPSRFSYKVGQTSGYGILMGGGNDVVWVPFLSLPNVSRCRSTVLVLPYISTVL